MTTWFTSDTHFSHANILKYCNRPFYGTDHMDETLINNWNALVDTDDVVYHLGDVALGPIDSSLEKIKRLEGYKILVVGNHDRPFMRSGKPDANMWWDRYAGVFNEVVHWKGMLLDIGDGLETVKLSHFPYDGDHSEVDRYQDVRPKDIGTPLVHGHTHSNEKFSLSAKGTPQVHVGVDAWNFFPVSEEQVIEVLESCQDSKSVV